MKDEEGSSISRRRLLLGLGASAFACAHPQWRRPVCARPGTVGGLIAHCEHLVAFDNIHSADPLVVRPESVAALREFLQSVDRTRKISFRSGGLSIDGQSLNDDVVVLMSAPAFRHIGPVRQGRSSLHGLITVGAFATWREILRRTAEVGFVPRTVPSAGDVTAGGSASAHSISRFSPVWHKEGDHIYELKVVTMDGELRVLRGDAPEGSDEQQLFRGVIGGLGFLGAIVEVTYELLRVAPARAQVQVATRSSIFAPLVAGRDETLWFDLLTRLRRQAEQNAQSLEAAVESAPPASAAPEGAAQTAPGGRRAGAAPKGSKQTVEEPMMEANASLPAASDPAPLIIPDTASTVYASIWWSGDDLQRRAMLVESRYVYDHALAPMLAYEPDNELMGVMEELMMTSAALNRLVLDAATSQFASSVVAVTPVAGFTFFQDANLLVREREYTGATSIVLQQTFILPDAERGAAFLEELTEFVRGPHEYPTLCDLMWLPRDKRPFLLSATSRCGGFALTLTYLRPGDADRLKIQEDLKALTAKCRLHGGRIHLVKSVEIGHQRQLEETYHAQFEAFRALKARYDPEGQLVNEFYRRVLGRWGVPVPAPARPDECPTAR